MHYAQDAIELNPNIQNIHSWLEDTPRSLDTGQEAQAAAAWGGASLVQGGGSAGPRPGHGDPTYRARVHDPAGGRAV